MTYVQTLDVAVRASEEWVDEFMRRLGWHDRELVYAALIAGLHALRDSLPREEAVYVGASLPPLLRGLYYEGWHPAARVAVKSRAAFLARIHDGVHRNLGVDSEQVAHALFALLAARVPASELEDAKAATPKELKPLWPA